MPESTILFDVYGNQVAAVRDASGLYRLEVVGSGGNPISTTEINKIDSAASKGLDGIVDSIAYRIHETERHMHSYERWFGAAAVPNGEIHIADRVGTTSTNMKDNRR